MGDGPDEVWNLSIMTILVSRGSTKAKPACSTMAIYGGVGWGVEAHFVAEGNGAAWAEKHLVLEVPPG